MAFSESDIDFSNIDWLQFEELCYDLVSAAGFHSLAWRQGGSDQGRDIEARLSRTNLLVSGNDEKWFIECKHQPKGVNLDDISSKIEWAEVDSADVFLLMTTGYVTNDTRRWLDGKRSKAKFRIEIIEGKELKQKIVSHHEIVEKYFLSPLRARLASIKKQWLHFDILPDVRSFYDLYNEVELNELNIEDLGFLAFVFSELEEKLDDFCSDEGLEELGNTEIISMFGKYKNCDYSIIQDAQSDFNKIVALSRFEPHYLSMKRISDDGAVKMLIHDVIENGLMLDVIIERIEKKLDVKISVR